MLFNLFNTPVKLSQAIKELEITHISIDGQNMPVITHFVNKYDDFLFDVCGSTLTNHKKVYYAIGHDITPDKEIMIILSANEEK